MSGIFKRAYDTPYGLVAPSGKRVEWELINIFLYDANGRLAEEWVQYDYAGLLRQLGAHVVVQPTGK